jgi:hypothetical protein
LLAVELQEASLVLTRRVEDEVVEPKLEVRPELF